MTTMSPILVHVDIPPSYRRKSAIKRTVEIIRVTVTSCEGRTDAVQHFDVLVRCDDRTFGVRAFGYHKDDGSPRVSAISVQQTWNDEFPPLKRRCQRRDAAHTIAIKHAVEQHLLAPKEHRA